MRNAYHSKNYEIQTTKVVAKYNSQIIGRYVNNTMNKTR